MATKTIDSILASLPKVDVFVVAKFEKNKFSERLVFDNIDAFDECVQELHKQGFKISRDLMQDKKVNANR